LLFSENRVLGTIYGPNRDKVMGEWRKVHKKELQNLYCPPNIMMMIKSRRIRWMG
jgi:hypothetical protein